MQPQSPTHTTTSQTKPPQTSPNRSTTAFKTQFFNLIRTQQSNKKIQNFLLTNRNILSQKLILHLYVVQPKLYKQFKYLLLALSLLFDKKQQYSMRWNMFYQIVNQILKISVENRKQCKIQEYVIYFTYYLLDNVTLFFQEFQESLKLLKSSHFINNNNNNNNSNKNQQENLMLNKRIVRIFNSLLCLKFITPDQYIVVIYYFGLKSKNYVEYLVSIQDKFVKKLVQYQNKQRKQLQNNNSSNSNSTNVILSIKSIYKLLHIFYDIDPQNKLKQLLKSYVITNSISQFNSDQQQSNQNQIQSKQYIKNKINLPQINLLLLIKKQSHKQIIHYNSLLKFILKQIIKNKSNKINIQVKKQFIMECFNQIQQIDQELFQYLLEAQGNQNDQGLSDVLMKTVERQALRFATVSRLKSILRRINLSKMLISYTANINKMFRILRLLYWLAKKFNQSNPTYLLKLNSSIKISNLSKAMMIIFSVDFSENQVGRIIQFQINKQNYDILIKYAEIQQTCSIQIITQVDGQQKLKEKKQVNKWSYILCMVGLCDKKKVSIFIDGACFNIDLSQNASQIKDVQFGPFSGSIKDVYILDKVYEMAELHKGYFRKFRKMNQLLNQLGQKSFIFTFDRGRVAEQSKWFWKKQMTVEYKNTQKLRSISFGEGIQQLGGIPSLLFLVSRVVTSQKNDQLAKFLIDFFEFLKLLINQSQIALVQKWVTNSTVYFGEFLWLILCRNQNLRNQKLLFNRVFDFFGWFFINGQLNNSLRISILENIYLNFQIWSKCSTQIKMLLFGELLIKLNKQQSIMFEIFRRNQYQNTMSSLVYFFLDEKPDEDSQSHYISGVKASLVHDQISRLGSKFCQLYTNQKVQNNPQIIRRDLILIMALINTFFQKKKLYFSQSQLSSLAILLSHLKKNFIVNFIFQKTLDHQIFVFDQLTNLISISPLQSQLIFLLFQLAFIMVIQLENIKNGTALIIDRFTLYGKRAEDSLQFSYKLTMYIVKNSKVIYEPNSIFNQQQVLSVLLGSLRNKANSDQNPNIKKLSFSDFTKQFETFSLSKLQILFSLTQFCMLIKQCVNQQDIFLTATFFLKVVIKNNIFPEANPLVNICIKITCQSIRLNSKNSTKIKQNNLTEHQLQIQKKQQKQTQQKIMIEQKSQKKQLLSNKNYENAIKNLKQTLRSNDLQMLFKNCRNTQLIQILVSISCLNYYNHQLLFPFNTNRYQKSQQFSNNLLILLKQQNLNLDQIQKVLAYFNKQNQQKSQQQYQISNLSFNSKDFLQLILPLFISYNVLNLISSDIKKGPSTQITSIINKSFQFVKIKQIFRLFTSIKAYKPLLVDFFKNNQQADKTVSLTQISNKISSQYEKNKNTSPIQIQLTELKQKLVKNPQQIQTLFQNFKLLKKLIEDIRQVIDTYLMLARAFTKNTNKNLNGNVDKSFAAVQRRKTIESNKKKKLLQINDPQQRQLYNQDLNKTIKNLCLKLQKQSKKRQQLWKSLYEKNNFWVASKIKNNQCYEIHPKITGFYRLNIVKTAFDQVPYPRRKSFQHEFESSNQQQPEIESKQSGVQMMKTIMPLQQTTQQNLQRMSSSDTYMSSSSNLMKNNIKIPKDAILAQYVTPKGVYAGIFYYSSQYQGFIFKCKGYDYLPKDNLVYQFSTIVHRINDLQFKVAIQVNEKTEIFARRYILRHTAIQIFSHNRTHFINFFFKDVRDKFFKNFSNKVICISDVRSQFQKRKYTQKWMNGELDNFEYLMLVNIFSGRTLNDLAQYPVMPWVLKNYNLQQVELNKAFLKDQKNIRDLSKPAGKLDEKKFQGLKMRCLQMAEFDPQGVMLYGTMYSNPTVIYNFFIRLQPYTTLHWDHQSGKIDHADRLFSAVKDQFNTIITSTSDNKQLVPQFYYWPQFLKNRNKVNLGIKQNKQQVHDVKLPGWAKNPQQFIFKMRQILQSPQVTVNLHKWIDLIFGYKNPKQVALEHDNLFHYLSYEHDLFQNQDNQQSIKSSQISISQFGQIPYPLFTKPHNQRTLVFTQHFKLDNSMIMKKSNNRKINNLELTNQGFFICYDKQVEFYYQQTHKILGNPLQKPNKSYTYEGSSVKLYDFSNNIWFSLKDGIFKIYDKKQIILQIDCEMQCYSYFGKYIIYGFRSELIVGRIQNTYKLSKINSFYGHKSNIYKIGVNTLLDVVVSIDSSGLVLVHQFSKQKLLRQFQLGAKLQVVDLCIHQMGYFIFFTKDQKLIIYTFLGELYFNQDVGISNAVNEQITKIAILQHNRSLLLFATDKGKLYLIDFMQIKRFNDFCVYKQFSRFKNNILENCPSKLGTTLAIKDFVFKRVPGKSVLTYKIYVLYANSQYTQIQCYYSNQQFQQKIKKNKMLGQLGLFDSQT